MFDIDHMKSYATEAALEARLGKLSLSGIKYLVVCNRGGRFTAIFPLHMLPSELSPFAIAAAGFMVIG